jgi:tol-pal system protein YbgF
MRVLLQSARTPLVKKLTAALMVAVTFLPGAVINGACAESRLSLADRVSKLEAQAANNSSQQTQVEMLQRIQDLQAEVQQLRGDSEKQSMEVEQLKKRVREQYLELDGRVQNLSGGRPTTPAGNLPSASDTPVNEPVPPTTSEPVANTATPAVAGANERADYDVAFGALKRGQYAEASKLFEGFLQKYPSGAFADSASYWLGESYYVTQRYQQALKTFQGALARFPQSKKAPDSLLKVGYCHYQLGDTAKASSTLKSVIERYPDQPVAKLAEGRLRALQLDGK